jgi:UDP-glucose 6-dehydrogenase
VVLTEWEALREVDLCKAGAMMEHRSMVDARNLFDSAAVRSPGLRCDGIGRS